MTFYFISSIPFCICLNNILGNGLSLVGCSFPVVRQDHIMLSVVLMCCFFARVFEFQPAYTDEIGIGRMETCLQI